MLASWWGCELALGYVARELLLAAAAIRETVTTSSEITIAAGDVQFASLPGLGGLVGLFTYGDNRKQPQGRYWGV
ncbi:MAG: hypothetical protein M3Z66_04755 [Chloroflexota bacterium]|nr:hypothetical protein [Chloroflexota bacterium]